MLKARHILLSLLLLTITSNPLLADPLKIGDRLPEKVFSDQHDKLHRLDNRVELLIFAHTKQMGTLMTDILAHAGADLLQRHNAIYLADISGMPSLIAKFIALPKMRKIDSPICLVRDAEEAAWLPTAEDKLTLLQLDSGRITAISFTAEEETIRSLLEIPGDSADN